MDHEHLQSLKVAILVADGFEQPGDDRAVQPGPWAGAATCVKPPGGGRIF